MNDTIELVVKISKDQYEICKQVVKDFGCRPITECEFAIAVGTPLDDVKAKIEEMPTDYCGGYIGLDKNEVLQILDNIGKAESKGE